MSTVSVRRLDPSAAPLCWSLAIESEFHRKVYRECRDDLNEILKSGNHPVPRERQTCGIGQILALIQKTRAAPLKTQLIEKAIPSWRRLSILYLDHVDASRYNEVLLRWVYPTIRNFEICWFRLPPESQRRKSRNYRTSTTINAETFLDPKNN